MVSFIVHFFKDYTIKSNLGNQKIRKFGRAVLIEENCSKKMFVAKIVDRTLKKESIARRLKAESTFSFEHYLLPQVIQHKETEEYAYLILAFKPGETIDRHWKTLKRIDRHPFLLRFLTKLNGLFEILIKEGVTHCDIKPSNIIIHQTANDFDVFLIDFGLAMRSENNNNRSILFPLGYAAPELLLNHLDIINHQTDIFSLGILIWRLYVGELPLKHPNPSIYTNLQLTHPLPEHSRVPNETFRILEKMTAKHIFQVPPNKMIDSLVKEQLKKGQSHRYQDLTIVIQKMQMIKFYLFQLISRR